MTTEQQTKAKPFAKETRFLQEVAATAHECGFRVADFKLGGNGKDRVMTLKVSRAEDDSDILASGQTDFAFGGDGDGPARAEEHTDSRFRQGRPQIAPPPDPPARPSWYQEPGGPDQAGS